MSITSNRNVSGAVQALTEQWGKGPVAFDGAWVDTSELPLSVPELDEFLRTLPKGLVFARQTSGRRDDTAPQNQRLDERSLQQRLDGGHFHLNVNDLHFLDDRFARVLDQFLENISTAHPNVLAPDTEATIGLFLASAKTVVPFHVDFEHNFLIQIYGDKTLFLAPPGHTASLPQQRIEHLSANFRSGRFLEFKESYTDDATALELSTSRKSTYQPPLAPHWVINGDAVTLSIAIGLYTATERRLRTLHRANRVMRKFGASPPPIAQQPSRDTWVSNLAAGALKTKKIVRQALGKPELGTIHLIGPNTH